MNESKMTYIALALGAGALAVSAASAVLSALPNSSKIDALSTEVKELRELNTSLQDKLAIANQNRTRIDELDIGLTAMANVMNIDRQQLAKAMMAMKTGGAAVPPSQQSPAETPKAIQAPTAADLPQGTQAKTAASSLEVKPSSISATPVIPAEAKPPKPTAKALDALLEPDNPFEGEPDTSTNAGGQVPALIANVPVDAPTLTIQHVDSILAKRISENWYKPAGASANLNAIIQLKMSREGKVESVELTRPSGNPEFDGSVISAVKSIGAINEVQRLSDADFQKAYANRNIQFTPQMGG